MDYIVNISYKFSRSDDIYSAAIPVNGCKDKRDAYITAFQLLEKAEGGKKINPVRSTAFPITITGVAAVANLGMGNDTGGFYELT